MALHSKIGHFQGFDPKYGVDKSPCPHMFRRPCIKTKNGLEDPELGTTGMGTPGLGTPRLGDSRAWGSLGLGKEFLDSPGDEGSRAFM